MTKLASAVRSITNRFNGARAGGTRRRRSSSSSRVCLSVVAGALGVLGLSRGAHAQTNDNCSSTSNWCVTGSNSLSGGGGILAVTTNSTALYGQDNGQGYGVHGESATGIAVWAQGTGGTGLYAQSNSGQAIVASSTGSSSADYGIYTTSTNSDALYAEVNNGNSAIAAVQDDASGGYALYVTSSATGNAAGRFISSGSYNAIYATNPRTDLNAAVISAAAGNASGLAYYGNGAIWITGAAYKAGGGQWSALSDQRLKKDITDYHSGLRELMRVRPVTYKYNGLGGTQDDGMERVGVIAQELERVLPRMVSTRKAKLNSSDAEQTDIKQVDPSDFTYVLINAVQEQQRTIDLQGQRIAELESGRQPRISGFNLNGVGFGVGGLTIGLGLVISRRKREERPSKP
jgi:hypothetical protein